MDWLKREAQEAWGGLGNEINRAVGGASNQAQGAANNIRNVIASQPRNIQRAGSQVQQTFGRGVPQVKLPPPDVLGDTLKAIDNISRDMVAKQYGVDRTQLEEIMKKPLAERANFAVKRPLELTKENPAQAIMGSPLNPTQAAFNTYNKGPVQLPQVDTTDLVNDASDLYVKSGLADPVTGWLGENLVKPMASSVARYADVTQGQQKYSEGTKGLAEFGTDAFNTASLFYTPLKAPVLARGGMPALKAIPGAMARGTASGTGINALYQASEKGTENIDWGQALQTGVAGGLLNTTVPLAGGALKRGAGKAISMEKARIASGEMPGGFARLPGGNKADDLFNEARKYKSADELAQSLAQKKADGDPAAQQLLADMTSKAQKLVDGGMPAAKASSRVFQDTHAQLTLQPEKYASLDEFLQSQGKPLYHGTDAKFDRYSLGNFGKTDEGFTGKGIYLSGRKGNARQYGKNVIESYSNLKNPLEYNDSYSFGAFSPDGLRARLGLPPRATAEQVTNELKARGHDGVVIHEDTGKGIRKNEEVVVLDPSQVRTKQQLTDLYNQATKGVESKGIAQVGKTDLNKGMRPGDEMAINVAKRLNLPEYDVINKVTQERTKNGGSLLKAANRLGLGQQWDDAIKATSRAKLTDDLKKNPGLGVLGNGDTTPPQVGKPKVELKQPDVPVKTASKPTEDPKLLDIKIARVKDPARKAELIAEKQARIDTAAPKVENLINNPKEPGAVKRAWQSVSGVISQYGEGGKRIVKGLDKQRNEFEVGQAKFIASIPTVGKLNKNEMAVFAQTLDSLSKGESVKVSPKIKQAITEWNKAIPTIRERALAAGLDVGDLGPNYFPRMYRDAFNSDRKMAKIAERMVADAKASGKELSMGDAIQQLRFMKNEYQRPFGNLEKTREFDIPGYDMSHDAVYDYITRSFDRITKAEQFGAKNEKLNDMLAKAVQDGYNATPNSVLDKYVKIALGDVDKGTPAHKVSSAIRKFNAVRSLSTAGISNATQTINTATIAGIGRTIKGMAKTAFSKKVRNEVDLMGVSLDNTIKTLSEQGLGVSGKITRNIASPFFATIEKFNREATAVVGVDYGNSLAKRAANGSKRAEATLRNKFGVEGKIGKTLTPDQQTQVARKLVELSQFKVDPRDLPGWVDSPMGKIVAQFRTFGYKQTSFMYNQVLREATKGNFLPLTRFVALAMPLGAASLYVKGKIKGVDYVDQEESPQSKGLKYLSAVGGLGLPGDTAQNLYKSAQYENTIGGIAGIAGPTAGLVAETSANTDKGIRGDWTALKKQGVRSIPMVGPSIANRAFPTEEQKIKSADETSPGIKKIQDNKGQDKYYVKELDKKFDSEASAKKAIDEKKFVDSGLKTSVIGDKYWYLDKDGEPKSKSLVQHTFNNFDSKASLEMDRAKARDDLDGWLNNADKKYQAYEALKKSYDPITEQDKIDDITLKQENLLELAKKYSDYGGFTKPKKGRSGSSRTAGSRSGGSGGSGAFITTGFKTAAQMKAPKISGIKVKSPTYKGKAKKLSVKNLPKIKSA